MTWVEHLLDQLTNEPLSLADSFARAGFLTVAPDLFGGEPSPLDMNDPSFNRTAFQVAHGPNATDPLVDLAISFMRTDLQVTRLALAGYCFGGRYAFRYADTRRTLRPDVAYAAHPSSYTDDEAAAIDLPVSVAAAGESHVYALVENKIRNGANLLISIDRLTTCIQTKTNSCLRQGGTSLSRSS